MAELVIPEPFASQLKAIMRGQGLDNFGDLLASLIDAYPAGDPHNPLPRPASSLKDEYIEVPDDIEDVEGYREAVRAMYPKLYRIARRYWLANNDVERLSLTDEELDRQFWLIDENGVPRFKSEHDDYVPPHDPLQNLIEYKSRIHS